MNISKNLFFGGQAVYSNGGGSHIKHWIGLRLPPNLFCFTDWKKGLLFYRIKHEAGWINLRYLSKHFCFSLTFQDKGFFTTKLAKTFNREP